MLQVLEDQDLGLQFGDGFCRRSLIDDLVGVQFVLLGAQCVIQLVDVVRQFDLLLDRIFAQRLSNAVLLNALPSSDQFHLLEARFQAFASALERLVDGFRAGGETALKLGQRKADGTPPFAVEIVGPIHLVADVVGDRRIERGLGVGQFVVGAVGAPLGK